MSEDVYVVSAIGDHGSEVRKHADEVFNLIITPVAKACSLAVGRSDREATPGHISIQILQGILQARIVVADLTGKNANVFYELAFAQSFAKPVVMLVDDTENLPFDTRNDRAIPLGDSGSAITLEHGDEAKRLLRAAFDKVLDDGYEPTSLIREVAGLASLAKLGSSDPIATELSVVRETVEEIAARLRTTRLQATPHVAAEAQQLRRLVTSLVEQKLLSDSELRSLITNRTSDAFDAWVVHLQEINPRPADGDIDPDDIPF